MARDALSRLLPAGDSGDRRSDAVLLISELVTNSVRHASLPPEGPISCSFGLRDGRLRVEVSDPGRGFPVLTSTGADGPGTSGWGLLLVERLADAWGVGGAGRGETTVWFEIAL